MSKGRRRGLDRPWDHSTEDTIATSIIESYNYELRLAVFAFIEKQQAQNVDSLMTSKWSLQRSGTPTSLDPLSRGVFP